MPVSSLCPHHSTMKTLADLRLQSWSMHASIQETCRRIWLTISDRYTVSQSLRQTACATPRPRAPSARQFRPERVDSKSALLGPELGSASHTLSPGAPRLH